MQSIKIHTQRMTNEEKVTDGNFILRLAKNVPGNCSSIEARIKLLV